MIKAGHGSTHRGDPRLAARYLQPSSHLSGEDALRTSGAVELLFMLTVVRTRLQRESSLDAVCWPRDRRRRAAVIRTSALSATSALSWRRSVTEARSQAWGEAKLTGSARAETFGRVVRAPMQKFLFSCFLSFATLTPNQAMQLTPTRCTTHV